MTRFKALSLYILLLFPPFILHSQTSDIGNLKHTATNVLREGRILSNDGRYTEALDAFKLYLNYRKKIYGEENYMLGSAYSYVGITYKNLGQNDLALRYYMLAEKNYLLRNNPNLSSLAKLYINIGNTYRAKLDYPNALIYFERALAIYKNQKSIDSYDISDANYSIAEIFYLLEDFQQAIVISLQNFETADDFTKIYLCNLAAAAYQRIKKYDDAKYYFNKTIQLTKSFFGEKDIEVAIAYMNNAQLLSETGQFILAMEEIDKAFPLIKSTQNNIGLDLARYYKYLGNIHDDKTISTEDIEKFKFLKKANLNQSIHFYKKSLTALGIQNSNPGIDSIEVNKCLSLLECINVIKLIGDANFDLALLDKKDNTPLYHKQLKNALTYYNKTSELIQRARKEISNDEGKIQLAELEYSTFAKTIETAFLAYEINKDDDYLEIAFNNSEQLKSSAVFDKIANDIAQENSIIPDTLLELESKLNNTISIFSEKLFEENNYEDSDPSLITEYNTKIFEASRQRDELNRYLEEEYADYYDLKYSAKMLNAADIQKKLDKKEAIVEYVLTENDSVSNLYTFLITNNVKKLLQQKIESKDLKALETVFRFMSTPNYIFTRNEDSKEFCEAANDLYKLLIHPISKELTNKNLVVIPDGQLNYVAFDGLLTSLPDTTKIIDFSKLNYLINNFNVSYANSANILIKNRNTKRALNNNTLAFAPEYNSEKFELSNASYVLMPLPGVKKEVEEIASTVKTKIFNGSEASEENFRTQSKDYDILHLAMHAYINDSLPAYSRLAFSPQENESDLQKDGWLNTADIYNLDLNARLAVLSACNTGVGKLQKGEGLMSLARGFLYAGCPSIIMSLWEVEDQAGTKIMTSFYKNLKRGKTKDEALRLAKISYLENSNSRLAHPHYWMSFKSIGDNSPIYASYDIYFFGFLFLLIIAFSVDQGIRIKKARRKRQAS